MSYTPNWRDRLVWRVCNAITRFATPEYRALLYLGHMKVHDEVMRDKPEGESE